ncbi:hypothetical protein [Pandoraea soli]
MHVDLKFMKSWGAYNVGEVARFTTDLAKTLLTRGIAVEHQIEQRVEAALSGASTGAETVQGAQAIGSADSAKPQAKAK